MYSRNDPVNKVDRNGLLEKGVRLAIALAVETQEDLTIPGYDAISFSYKSNAGEMSAVNVDGRTLYDVSLNQWFLDSQLTEVDALLLLETILHEALHITHPDWDHDRIYDEAE